MTTKELTNEQQHKFHQMLWDRRNKMAETCEAEGIEKLPYNLYFEH